MLQTAPTALENNLSLSVREHLSQAGGQALEGLGDVLQKNEARAHTAFGDVMKEVQELSGFSSSTTSA